MLGPSRLRELALLLALSLPVAACSDGDGSPATDGGAPGERPAGGDSSDESRARGPAEREGFPGPSRTEGARVTRVVDGDTIELSDVGKTRLIGVDTPEVFGGAECYGREASAFTKRLLAPGMRVEYRLGEEPRDRYGRALAYVWLRDGRLANGVLVLRGYAVPLTIPPNDDLASRFRAAARRARHRSRGLWDADTCGGEADLRAR